MKNQRAPPLPDNDSNVESLIRVLCVDDENSFLNTTKQILELQNLFYVETASSVKEALQKMESNLFDVVVSDYLMPEQNGLDFLRTLRESGNDIPFILFTGKSREEVAVRALNLGADRFFNKNGNPETVYGELVHILKKTVNSKRAEKALHESEEKFRTLAEQSPNMIFINQDEKIVYVNPKCEELMGYTKEEFYSPDFSFLILISPEFRKSVKSNYLKQMKGEKVPSYEYSFTTKKGKVIDVILTTKLITYQGHRAIIGTITDVTKRKKAEEVLQRERQLLEHITEKMGAVLAVISPQFRVLGGNSVLKKMHDPLEGQICYELFSKRDHVCPGCGVKEVFETGKDLVVHQQAVPGPDGHPYWLELYATPIRDKSGKITAALELVVDINERKESEKKIETIMEKLLVTNEKLSVVSKLTRHDARNKLSVITNNLYLAKNQLAENNGVLEYLDSIDYAIEQMEELFDFARIYEKVGTEELSYVDVTQNVDEAILLFTRSEDKKFVNECGGLNVLADSLLRQIFYNLIDNSLKHGETVSQIRIYYTEGKDDLKLVYEDDGVGIAEAEKEHIFKEGYGKGTGYGLYLIKKTCEAYGWTIQETGVPNKGAQFTITIPKTRYIIKEP